MSRPLLRMTYTRAEVTRLLLAREIELRTAARPVLATVAAQRIADALNDATAAGFAVRCGGLVMVGDTSTISCDETGRWTVADDSE